MSKTRYYSVLIPLLLLFTYSINYGQLNPDSKELIEDRLNNPALVSELSSKNPSLADIDNKDEPLPLNPTQYLLRSGSWPYGASHSVAVDSINNIIYLGSGGAVLVLDGNASTAPLKNFVGLKVFDILGNEVASLVNKEQLPGNYEVIFNGNNLASGVYYYRLETENFSSAKKMILLK